MICPIVCFILNQECMLIGHTYLTYSNGNIHSIQSLLNEDLLILIEHSHSSKSLGGNHVDTIWKKAASGNPSIIVCPLPPCMLSITATNHILTTTASYGVACAPIGYWAQPPLIGHYVSYLHQHSNSRGHRVYKLTFRNITLILFYQMVTSWVSW